MKANATRPTPARTAIPIMLLLALFIACRMILTVLAPHQDPSEARYAEISRKMVETGDWITPQHLYGVPFWAKPPLSMWMSAMGMCLFGINEFGSRILIFLAAAAVLFLVARFAWREWSPIAGIAAATILMGMPLFFYCSAAVMTDLALAAGTTLSMIAFYLAVKNRSKRWGFAFFAGLAIGLLAKGPLVGVLVVPPIALWLIFSRQWKDAWNAIPWITGGLLTLVLVFPWYLAAESKTPGFLNYFLIGEHWNRFVRSGWEGDLYGKAHAEAPGTIWLFAVLGTFPWCFALVPLLFRRKTHADVEQAIRSGGFPSVRFQRTKRFVGWAMADHARALYLMAWALWPILFFTPARNIIATYPLPALPAIALLLASLVSQHFTKPLRPSFHPFHPAITGGAVLVVAIAMMTTFVFPDYSPKKSERELVRSFLEHSQPGDTLLYFGKRRYSGEFYSQGKALNTRSATVLGERLDEPGTLYAVIEPKAFATLPPSIRVRLEPVHESSSFYQETKAAPHLSHQEEISSEPETVTE